MLPRTPLTQLIPDRLKEADGRLQQLIWHPVAGRIDIAAASPRKQHVSFADAKGLPYQAVTSLPHVWGRMWDQAWFRIDLPPDAFGQGLYLKWDDEAEATLYAEGMPWYGIDAAHHFAPLPRTAQTMWIEGVVCRTGIWVNDGKAISADGSTLRGASLWRRDDLAWKVYWDFHLLTDLLGIEFSRYMDPQDGSDGYARSGGFHQPTFTISSLYRRVIQGMDRFCDVFDRDGLAAAAPILTNLYQEVRANPSSIDAVLTGHAHIDLVWLWPERVGEAKAVHTFATVNRLMANDADLHFGYSQPASYDAVAQRSPELIAAVKQRIAEGRWDATGGSDVECDTQLPCGEALARSFMIGQERFKQLRGEPSKVMWLPDVFGFSGCLPQIMQQTGIDYFYSSKTSWSAVNRFPHSSFVWAGTDGSEVIVHLGQEPGYNGGLWLNHVRKLEESHQQVGIHNEVLIPTGYGDGGGGPTEEMLERAKRLRDLSGMPRCRWGGIEDFFERMQPLQSTLPRWNGEIFLEFHRGVHTTHGELKHNFRAAERALQLRESVHSVSGQGPIPTAVWRRVIFAQFHDAIPGSSIREVTDEMNAELAELVAHEVQVAQDVLCPAEPADVDQLFNPLPLAQTIVADGRLHHLPPLGVVPIASGTPVPGVQATTRSLQNEHLHAVFSPKGEISELTIDGQRIADAGSLNQLWLYPDHPHNFPAWEIDRGTLGNGKRVEAVSDEAQVDIGAGEASVSFRRQLSERSSAIIRYRLAAGSDVLHLEYDIDWQDPQVLLKAVFPTRYQGKMARCGAPFGSVLRPQHGGDPQAEAMWEVPASRWACMSDDGEHDGLAIITEAKYGMTIREGCLGLSLLRSAAIIHAEEHLGIRSLSTDCPYSDIGPTTIRCALTRFAGNRSRHSQPAALAETLYQPPVPTTRRDLRDWGFRLEGGESLIPCWTQPCDDGSIIIRCHETLGHRGCSSLRVAAHVQATLVDLSGNPSSCAALDNARIRYEPYALFGIRLELVT